MKSSKKDIMNPQALFTKCLLLLLCWSATSLSGFAQTFDKTIDQSYDAKEKVEFRQDRGPLTVLKSPDGKVRFVTEIRVEANAKEIADQFFQRFEANVTEGGDHVDIELKMCCVKRWHSNNGRTTITFNDGTRLKGLKNYKLKTTLYVPTTQKLELESRFEDITINTDVSLNDLDVKLFTAELEAGKVNGNLDLELKFGKASLGDVGARTAIDLHNSKLKMGHAKEVKLNTRFSDIQMGNVSSMRSDSHNDRIEVGNVSGQLDVNGKFTTYVFKAVGDADIKSHNGNFEFESGGVFDIDGKFSDFEIGRLSALKAWESHNNDFDIEELGTLHGKAQFSTFRIEKLLTSLNYTGHSGRLRIRSIGPDFTGIDIDGKFFEIDLTLPPAAQYHLFADLNFGSFSGPNHLEFVKQIEKLSEKEYVMRTSNAKEGSPKVNIEGHNLTVRVH